MVEVSSFSYVFMSNVGFDTMEWDYVEKSKGECGLRARIETRVVTGAVRRLALVKFGLYLLGNTRKSSF